MAGGDGGVPIRSRTERLDVLEGMQRATMAALEDVRESLAMLSQPPMETVTAGSTSYSKPVIRSLPELMDALGMDIGSRHGEAIARGEIGATDAWQVALTALAHLRTCVDAALKATPIRERERADDDDDYLYNGDGQ